ncbi:hypothetical protein A0H81_06446 [Grifola frondosa]|uniref:Uncharacterized protein n=1 Tax=Grifola frondosa TaxID=5627 RepID=A0A1C7MAT5_GRIFR|nr:hypothetical protein A0H81_06446 [Grifola frondosa]
MSNQPKTNGIPSQTASLRTLHMPAPNALPHPHAVTPPVHTRTLEVTCSEHWPPDIREAPIGSSPASTMPNARRRDKSSSQPVHFQTEWLLTKLHPISTLRDCICLPRLRRLILTL